MIILVIALAIVYTIAFGYVVMRHNARYLEELKNCYEEIDELNNEIKNLKQELEEAYEELASR